MAAAASLDRHPHLDAPLADGWVRVDLHSHTMWSGDSTTTPDELAAAVVDCGIDVLAITDHNATRGAHELRESLACRVIIGEEVKTHAGEIIGLFLQERIPFGLPPFEVAAAIRDQGGIVYIPHPFDPMRNNLSTPALLALCEAGLVDGIEARNGKTSLEHLNAKAVQFGMEHGLFLGGGSDAHVPEALGAVFSEVPDFDVDDPQSFLASMRHSSSVVIGHHFDAPRVWRPRIVPSTTVD